MGVRQVGTEEVTGGELRGGGGYGGEVIFGFRWSLVEPEALGSSARLRGSSWWRWIGGGSSGCDERHWIAAATELAGDEEERTFPDDCWPWEHYGGGLGLPECSEEHGASFYSTTGLAPRRWIRSTTGRRCCSCRASWRRRTRADEHEDKHGLFPGAAGVRGWLGRRRPRQSPLPTPACRQGSPDGGTVGRQGGLEGTGEWARAGRGSAGE